MAEPGVAPNGLTRRAFTGESLLLTLLRGEIDALEEQLDQLDAEYPVPSARPPLRLLQGGLAVLAQAPSR